MLDRCEAVIIYAVSPWHLPDGGTGTWEKPHGRSVNGLPCPRRQEGPPSSPGAWAQAGGGDPVPSLGHGSAGWGQKASGSRCCHMSRAGAEAVLAGMRDAGEDARRNSWYLRL